MSNSADILPDTLDLLILKAVSLGSPHGYGIVLRIQQISRGAFEVEQGALYRQKNPEPILCIGYSAD